MPLLSAIDAASPAFARMKAMLLRPFRVKTWIKIGFIGWLAGGIASSGGNFNYRTPSFPSGGEGGGDTWKKISDAIHSFHLADYIWIIVAAAVVFLAISLVLTYLFCRFRFILFDTVMSGNAAIGRGWHRYRAQAKRYFGFWVIYTLVGWLLFIAVAGLPLWRAYKNGVFRNEPSLTQIFALIGTIILGAVLLALLGAIITTFANDFIVPLLALDDLRVGHAWFTLKEWIAKEPLAWAGYLGMKLVFSIGFAIATGIVAVIVIGVLAIPAVILLILGVALFKSAGAVAVVIGILLAVVLGLAFFVFCMLFTLFISAPGVVFFQSYSLYFLGGRYAKLGALLWPGPPPMQPASPRT
ncbi:MAG TPA: hypothetical protein VN176_00940 [Verrucomicrobiae bacterium]|jgi:hypothetical protein|nr:hypothetical protein [Verrucomicrobiae bacterium]